jgi:hypothetical protein
MSAFIDKCNSRVTVASLLAMGGRKKRKHEAGVANVLDESTEAADHKRTVIKGENKTKEAQEQEADSHNKLGIKAPKENAGVFAAAPPIEAALRGVPAHHKVPPLDRRNLHELVDACTMDAVIASFTPDEREAYDAAGTKAGKNKLVMDKYTINVGKALDYFGNYLFVVKGSGVTYAYADYDGEGGVCTVKYKSKAAMLRNWEEFHFTNEIVSKRPLHIAKLWLDGKQRRTYDQVVFEPGTHYPYEQWGRNVRNLWTEWAFEYNPKFVHHSTLFEW